MSHRNHRIRFSESWYQFVRIVASVFQDHGFSLNSDCVSAPADVFVPSGPSVVYLPLSLHPAYFSSIFPTAFAGGSKRVVSTTSTRSSDSGLFVKVARPFLPRCRSVPLRLSQRVFVGHETPHHPGSCSSVFLTAGGSGSCSSVFLTAGGSGRFVWRPLTRNSSAPWKLLVESVGKLEEVEVLPPRIRSFGVRNRSLIRIALRCGNSLKSCDFTSVDHELSIRDSKRFEVAFELTRLVHDEEEKLGQGFGEGPVVGRDSVEPTRRLPLEVLFVATPVPSRLSEGDVEVFGVPAGHDSGAKHARCSGRSPFRKTTSLLGKMTTCYPGTIELE